MWLACMAVCMVISRNDIPMFQAVAVVYTIPILIDMYMEYKNDSI